MTQSTKALLSAALLWCGAASAQFWNPLQTPNPFGGSPIQYAAGDPHMRWEASIGKWVSTQSIGAGVQLFYSTDMRLWSPGPVIMDASKKPSGMNLSPLAAAWPSGMNQDVNFWAPEVHKVGNKFVVVTSGNFDYWYYTTYSRGGIVIGTASNIAGPYTFRSTPIIGNGTDTYIDPTVFQDPKTSKYYLAYVKWVGGNDHQSLDMIELNSTDPTQTVGVPRTLLSTATQMRNHEIAWGTNRRIIEGPGLFVAASGAYVLYYAAGNCEPNGTVNKSSQYSFNMAVSNTGATVNVWNASFTKSTAPSLVGSPGMTNPGHGSIVKDKAGKLWLYAHYHQDPSDGWRRVFMQPVLTSVYGYYFEGGAAQGWITSMPVP